MDPTILGALLADASSQASFDDLTRDQLTTLLRKAIGALSAGSELIHQQSTEIEALQLAVAAAGEASRAAALILDSDEEPIVLDPTRVTHARMCDLLQLSLQQMRSARPGTTH